MVLNRVIAFDLQPRFISAGGWLPVRAVMLRLHSTPRMIIPRFA